MSIETDIASALTQARQIERMERDLQTTDQLDQVDRLGQALHKRAQATNE